MKSHKRILLALILCVLLTLPLAACNGKGNGNGDEPKDEISLSETSLVLEAGRTHTLTLNGLSTGGTVKWSSDNPGYATVKKGTITTHQPGKVKITATYNEKQYTCNVTVFSLNLQKNFTLIAPGQTEQLQATLSGLDEPLKYSSSDATVATVDGNGSITANKAGSATITVSVGEKPIAKKDFTVNVYSEIEAVVINDESTINYYGRVKLDEKKATFYNTASGFEVAFEGTTVTASFQSGFGQKIRVYVDGDKEGYVLPVTAKTVLCNNLPAGVHNVKVLKVNYEVRGELSLAEISGAEKFLTPVKKPDLKFEFYGDSLTVGYGINSDGTGDSISNEDGTMTYAQLTANYFNAQASMICQTGISVGVPIWINHTLPSRFDLYSLTLNLSPWNFSNYQADIVVINLGTNDAAAVSSGNGTDFEVEDAYSDFLEALREAQPNAKIVCMYGMMGSSNPIYKAIENAVLKADSNVYFLPVKTVSCMGHNGHADLQGHVTAADYLISFINSIM